MNSDPVPKVHIIRLHGPWKVRVTRAEDAFQEWANAAETLRLPDALRGWPVVGFNGAVRCERAFGKPTALAPGQAVWLNVELACPGTVDLNGQRLELSPNSRVRIEAILQNSNRLQIELQCSANELPEVPCEWIRRVCLEIDESDEASASPSVKL